MQKLKASSLGLWEDPEKAELSIVGGLTVNFLYLLFVWVLDFVLVVGCFFFGGEGCWFFLLLELFIPGKTEPGVNLLLLKVVSQEIIFFPHEP